MEQAYVLPLKVSFFGGQKIEENERFYNVF
jgi:hypothetical protein